MNRVWAMPNKITFSIKPIADLLRRRMSMGTINSIDCFARNSRLCEYTNDLNPETKAAYHMKALDFLIMMNKLSLSSDLVLFDPPYTFYQAKVCYESVGQKLTKYDSQYIGRWTHEKQEIGKLVKKGGIVISFGHNSRGVGKKNGFEIIEILLVCHGGGHNDTICTVEKKVKP